MTRDTDRQTLKMLDTAYLDRSTYRAIHFFGEKLPTAFREAADYLEHLECLYDTQPYVASTHGTFSEDNAETGLAWKVTLILADGSMDDSVENI
jgi:hypothetical protein